MTQFTLTQYFQKLVSSISNESNSYKIHTVRGTSDDQQLCKFYKGYPVKTCTTNERLILLSYKDGLKDEGYVHIAGITSYESELKLDLGDNSLVTVNFTVIDKVDTTGIRPVRQSNTVEGSNITNKSATVQLLQTYIDFRLQQLTNSLIYLFSKPSKQYLFPNSFINKDKVVLNDRQLLKFWSKTLASHHILPTKSIKKSACGNEFKVEEIRRYVYVPGIEKSTIFNLLGLHDDKFHYKTIYRNEDVASEVVLQLKDDTKSRMLKTCNKELKIDEFLQVISIGEEFNSGKLAGIFYIERELNLKLIANEDTEPIDVVEDGDDRTEDGEKDLEYVLEALLNADYSNKESSIKATKVVDLRLRKLNVKSIIGTKNDDNNLNVLEIVKVVQDGNTTKEKRQPTQVNTLVPKRKKKVE